MSNRDVRIQIWLNSKDKISLDEKVKKSGLSREAYLRQLISGLVPQDNPPRDYHQMMRELAKVGEAVKRLSQKAELYRVIDKREYEEAIELFRNAVVAISSEVLLPKPMS